MLRICSLTYLIKLTLLTSLVVSVGGCTPEPRISSRGNSLDADRLTMIKIGGTNRETVTKILGSPSSKAVFGNEVWYYVSERQEVMAFFAPQITERQVISVEFDKDGTVTSVDKFGLEKSANVVPVERRTPTVGKEMTVIDQIVGNFNRFRTKNSAKANK